MMSETGDLKVKNNSIVKSVVAIYDTLFSCRRLDLDIQYIESQLTLDNYKDILPKFNDSSVVDKPLCF